MRPVACFVAASCLLAGLSSPAVGQSQPGVDLDKAFASIAPAGPGCVAGVSTGATRTIRAYGLADLEHPAPLTPESIFESGSLAKQFTAAAVLLLVQDGKLSLDDDIRRHLPEIPDYGTPITIRHLLNHTSGLREQWSLLALAGNPPGVQVHSQATILDLASRQKGLNFAPGAEFLYTNTNYTLAAIIVERVSGQSLQQFTDRRMFQPLGMTHTRWREDFRTVVPGRATAYSPADDGFIANMPFTDVYGNGGLLTTVGDLLSWNAFLDEPTRLIGGEDIVAALQTPGRLNDGAPIEYALGLVITSERGGRLVSHSGSTGGYQTWLGRYPDHGVSVALLCNHRGVPTIPLGEDISEQALRTVGVMLEDPVAPQSRPAAARVGTPARDLARYQGLFRNPVTGELVRTELVNGQLTLTGNPARRLDPIGDDSFQGDDGLEARFTTSGRGAAELAMVQGGRASRLVAVQPAGGEALAAYEGNYYSAELDTRITVVRQGDVLVMRQPFGVDWPLTPRFADGFTTPLRGSTSFVFTRGPDGRIRGFGAWAGGARDIRFARE